MVEYIDILLKTAIFPGLAGMIYWIISSMKKVAESQKEYFGQRIDDVRDDFRDIRHSLQEVSEANLQQHTQIYHRLDDFDRRQEDARLLTIQVKELAARNQELNAQSISKIFNTISKLPCVVPARNGDLEVEECPTSFEKK